MDQACRVIGLALAKLLPLALIFALAGCNNPGQTSARPTPAGDFNRDAERLLVHSRQADMLAVLEKVARETDRQRGFLCLAGQYVMEPFGVGEFLKPIQWNGKGMPVGGAWRLHVEATRCGSKLTFQYLLEAKPQGGLPRVVLMGVGDTETSTVLFFDIFKLALFHVLRASPGCRDIVLLDTSAPRVLARNLPGYQGAVDNHRQEVWWFGACGKQVVVLVDTYPSPSRPGAGFSVGHDPTAAAYRPR